MMISIDSFRYNINKISTIYYYVLFYIIIDLFTRLFKTAFL